MGVTVNHGGEKSVSTIELNSLFRRSHIQIRGVFFENRLVSKENSPCLSVNFSTCCSYRCSMMKLLRTKLFELEDKREIDKRHFLSKDSTKAKAEHAEEDEGEVDGFRAEIVFV